MGMSRLPRAVLELHASVLHAIYAKPGPDVSSKAVSLQNANVALRHTVAFDVKSCMCMQAVGAFGTKAFSKSG